MFQSYSLLKQPASLSMATAYAPLLHAPSLSDDHIPLPAVQHMYRYGQAFRSEAFGSPTFLYLRSPFFFAFRVV